MEFHDPQTAHYQWCGFVLPTPAPPTAPDKNERQLASSHFLVNNTHSPQGRNNRRGEAESASDTMYELLPMAPNQTRTAPGLGWND